MSNNYSSEASTSVSQIPTFSGSSSKSFAERARAKKAALEAGSRLVPPPGFSAPATTASGASTRGRPRIPSPSFYGVHDGRERRHAGAKVLLPITPLIAPSAAVVSPSTPSPIPRTPSPPPITEVSSSFQASALNSISSRTTIHNEAANRPLPSSNSASTTNSSATERRSKNVIRKRTVQNADPKVAMRTGSTTSTNLSSTSFTTSTSTSNLDRGHMHSVFGVSMPPTSYTYGARNISGSGGRHIPRTVGPPPGIPTSSTMQRTRSGSGSQTSAAPSRVSIPGIDSQLAAPRTGTIPPPLTIPAAVSENYNSSPSTANCGSPGMFSHASTPTSSSTNPSLFQSPGFSPPVQRVRNSSPTRPLISKYAGVTAATDKLGKAISMKRKESEGSPAEVPKHIKASSRSSLIPTNSSTASLSISKTRDIKAPTVEPASKLVQPSKHARKSSKDLLLKSGLSVGFTGFHFRKSSKDLTTSSTPSPQNGKPSHSRQSSRDSSNIKSPGETSLTPANYFPSTSPIPIPVPSASSSSLRLPPSRPSRDGAPDDLEGFSSEVPVIQSGIVTTKDSKAKGQKMKIITSSSLPYRSGAPFGITNGSTSSVNLASTSVPGQSRSIRVPTPTSAKGANVVHGFTSASSSSSTSLPTKPADNSPRKLKKEDRKPSADKTAITAAPPPTRSLFSRGRTKTIPAPSVSSEKDKSPLPKRAAPCPQAGTGHEVYSQFTRPTRTRSSSGSSIPTAPTKVQSSTPPPSGSWGRVAGANALKGAGMDDFLARRLEPVVMKGGVKPSGGADMARTGSSQSASSLLPKPSIKGESQKSSLDMSRTGSSQGVNSRDPSLDVSRKTGNEFDKFDFGTTVTKQTRPSITVEIPQSRPNIQSPTTAVLSPPALRTLQGKSAKSVTSMKSEAKESKLKAPKKLAPPQVGSIPQPTRRWNIFSRSQSAPDVSKGDTKTKAAPPKTAPQSPVLNQDVKFGDENLGGYIRDVHSPPIKPNAPEIPRLAPKQRVESVLLPEPPVMPRLVSRTPSPVTAVQANPPGLPLPQSKVIRPPPGLPIPANLKPMISVTSSTPTQPSKFSKLSELHNASPVSALTTSPSSVLTKSASPVRPLTRPSPANLPIRNIQELAEKEEQTRITKFYEDDEEEDESDEYTDEEDYIDDEALEVPQKPVEQTRVISPPITPKSVTPEPTTNPSPGRRQRLGNFAIGRIPKAANVESAATIKIPTLAEILPPPPSLREHQQQHQQHQQQPLIIHPPRRMAHPPPEPSQSSSSEGEDNDEGIDYINTRRIPLSKLAPLVTNGWSQIQSFPKRVSSTTDDWEEEYDDFLAEMSAATSRSKTPSLGAPFPDFTKFKPDVQDEIEPARRLKDSPTLPSAATFGVVTKLAPSNKKKLVLDQGKFTPERPIAARPFFSPTLPTTRSSLFGGSMKEVNSQRSSSTYSQRSSGNQKTIAFADFIAAYAEVDRGVMSVIDPLDKSGRHASSQARKMGLLSPMSSITDFEDDSSTDSDSYRDSIISAMPGTEDALEGEMKVRLWALMTSRWLSFGRVLVSPAHEEIKSAASSSAGKRILVIDGLGNDDWSFYCSLNYPNATVYNLTPSQATYPTSPASGRPVSGNPGDNPNNHHQIHHTSFASPFPFPSGFFSVVTFRFLPCTSDALWPFIISQCMRVLKPGGYLELSVLDIDMVNMGPRTKRTLDEIKLNLRKHQSGNGSDWSKKTPSEKALRLMAKRGFTDITRCRVGLPTVGNVDGSREEQASMQQILKEGNSPDEVDMGSAEGINRVVSKVGRWWYNKCFENIGEEHQGESLKYQKTMWEDKTLLRECEKKKTNFRMLISFARKPLN
ncbi:hypothetical protein TWF694_010728 [Orbilia ellipsospora]|uniref:Methyltransferase type 11 domain-containing protein n=1 Tax=Orbilia ellipsospora TaxID=2528407 RepID=A0AAV9X820_9PEZI